MNSETFTFECPTCGQHISAFHHDAGTSAVCPGCNNELTVPDTLDRQPPIQALDVSSASQELPRCSEWDAFHTRCERFYVMCGGIEPEVQSTVEQVIILDPSEADILMIGDLMFTDIGILAVPYVSFSDPELSRGAGAAVGLAGGAVGAMANSFFRGIGSKIEFKFAAKAYKQKSSESRGRLPAVKFAHCYQKSGTVATLKPLFLPANELIPLSDRGNRKVDITSDTLIVGWRGRAYSFTLINADQSFDNQWRVWIDEWLESAAKLRASLNGARQPSGVASLVTFAEQPPWTHTHGVPEWFVDTLNKTLPYQAADFKKVPIQSLAQLKGFLAKRMPEESRVTQRLIYQAMTTKLEFMWMWLVLGCLLMLASVIVFFTVLRTNISQQDGMLVFVGCVVAFFGSIVCFIFCGKASK